MPRPKQKKSILATSTNVLLSGVAAARPRLAQENFEILLQYSDAFEKSFAQSQPTQPNSATKQHPYPSGSVLGFAFTSHEVIPSSWRRRRPRLVVFFHFSFPGR